MNKYHHLLLFQVNIFTSFAENGKPVDHGETVLGEAGKSRDFNCFNISEKLENIKLPQAARFELWDFLYEKEKLPVY